MPTSKPLNGRTALVTGGAVRVGRAVVEQLAAAGAQVAIHCNRHREQADALADQLRRQGAAASVVPADLSQQDAPAQLFDQVTQSLGPVDILINSAAIFGASTLDELTRDHWRQHMALNLEAPVFLSQEFARRLPAGRPGAIVNIVDWRALKPPAGRLAYTIAKAGLATLTKILAQELGERIRVNAVAPGAILPAPDQSPAEFEKLADRNPLRRTGSPGDVAEAVLFLVTAPFINGEIVHVTGGEELA